jgi:hypothetical protein
MYEAVPMRPVWFECVLSFVFGVFLLCLQFLHTIEGNSSWAIVVPYSW